MYGMFSADRYRTSSGVRAKDSETSATTTTTDSSSYAAPEETIAELVGELRGIVPLLSLAQAVAGSGQSERRSS
jgi:hypothetical protein